VYLHSDRNKSRGRDRYLVTSVDLPFCNIRKFTGSQLHRSSYRVRLSEYIKVPPEMSAPLLPPSPHSDSHDDDDNEEQDRPEDTSTPQPCSNNQNVVPVLSQTPVAIVTDCPDLPVPDEDGEATSPPTETSPATHACQRRLSRPRRPLSTSRTMLWTFDLYNTL